MKHVHLPRGRWFNGCHAPASTRRFSVGLWLLVLACGSQTGLTVGDEIGAEALENQIRHASRIKTFRTPSDDELRSAERLFVETLRGVDPPEVLQAKWSSLHFELTLFASDQGKLLLLSEAANHETGRGFYAFRHGPKMPVALEAPHAFADIRTRRLAAQLFLESRVAAAAWNTVHRKIMDSAHTDACYLNAFTRAFVQVHQDAAVVCQLHGFSQAKRTTLAGRTSDLIVSNGTRSGALFLERVTANFRETLPTISVRLFPDEVSELGATTNRQAQLLRDAGAGKFLHLEMSAELRRSLVNDPNMRAESLKTLERVFRTQPSEYPEREDSETPRTRRHRAHRPLIRAPSTQRP